MYDLPDFSTVFGGGELPGLTASPVILKSAEAAILQQPGGRGEKLAFGSRIQQRFA